MMAKANKTTETAGSVTAFLNKVSDDSRRNDCVAIVELISRQTGLEAKMWGSAIIGFGNRHYVYESGREGDMPLVAFSPRKSAIVFYLSVNIPKREELLEKLGKHKTGKGCIYINALKDINIEILKKMVTLSVKQRS